MDGDLPMNQVARILQLTDLHLFCNQEAELVGINPFQTLQQVIAKISIDVAQNPPVLIVLTGDVSQDFSSESYELAAKILEDFKCPLAITMGNHDHLPQFTNVFNIPTQTAPINIANWRILILNSHWPEHVGGRLTDDELSFLQENLDKHPDQQIIIFLHHHVLPIGSDWLDSIKLHNSARFLEIIDQYKNVKAVICGHIHQDTTIIRQNVIFLSTPSTSWQFLIESSKFKLDTLMPGYRWLNLHEDGSIQTEVVRIAHNDAFVPDINSKGY